jgi:TolB-like protein
MPEPQPAAGAIFLSYAREDADAARRIADALRAFGLEVWFDQSELRGGDSWDAKIKTQIRTCALFLPIISAHTQKRMEGYFRREWKFGVERTHDMASGTAFVVPVAIDDTSESNALVPEEFMRFQWTRLPHGIPTSNFIEQVKRLAANPRQPAAPTRLAQGAPAAAAPAAGAAASTGKRYPDWVVGLVVAVLVGGVIVFVTLRKPSPPVPGSVPTQSAAKPVVPAAGANAKSIAVLPFANFSPDKDNEFFADGLQDEVITALAKIHDLKVISRTSVLPYKNTEGRNLKKIGDELGVATVLEGSVQRVGNKMHLNVQLIDARTDEHLWADSYTNEVTDVFSLESALAQQIASALKASLTSDEQALIGRRPTQNQEAYDLYLRARVMQETLGNSSILQDTLDVIALYERAGAKDPGFSLPHVQASILHGSLYWYASMDSTEGRKAKDLAELEIARRLAPTAPETRLAQGEYDYTCLNDWPQALVEFQAAEIGLPNDSQVHFGIGRTLRRMGRFPESIVEFEAAASVDPNDENSAYTVVQMSSSLRRYEKCVQQAKYYGERFPRDDFIKKYGAEAQFQLDGDWAALVRAGAVMNPLSDDERTLAYRRAILANDLQAAEHAVSSPELMTVANETGSITDPVSLIRACVAYLLGKNDAAKAFSGQAISAYGQTKWTRRQLPWAHMGIARAEAYKGDLDAAVLDGRKAIEEMQALDAYDATAMRDQYGKILVIAGRNDEALSVLAELIAGPGENVPRSYPHDQVWGRLKIDPRFEKILNSVKPL